MKCFQNVSLLNSIMLLVAYLQIVLFCNKDDDSYILYEYAFLIFKIIVCFVTCYNVVRINCFAFDIKRFFNYRKFNFQTISSQI